jgi:hypothetical protein
MDISQIQHTYYINLTERPDRKAQIIQELQKVGINNPERFNAIKRTSGAIGCSMSHLKCLENAKQQNWDHVLIVEDDITFLSPQLFVMNFNKFLKNCKNWDVVLIAGNNIPPYQIIDDTYVKISRCQCAAGYFVKNAYFDKLIDELELNPKIETIFVIGGEMIYKIAIDHPKCEKIYLNEVHVVCDLSGADAFFPEIDKTKYELTKTTILDPTVTSFVFSAI